MMKKPEPTEHQIQCSFIQWCKLSETKYPALKLAYAVPNGSYRHIVTAVRAKREGQKAGVYDWVLPVEGVIKMLHGYASLRAITLGLEFKRPGQRATREQKAYHSLARIYGHRVEIVTSAEEAIRIVKEYLS